MKSVRRDKEPEINYPCLMISDDGVIVVLFAEAEKGTLIYAEDSCCWETVGNHTDDWNATKFKIFNGEIDLSNINNEFPCLMISDNKDMIVLFTEVGKGIIVKIDHYQNILYDNGEYREDWEMDMFKHHDRILTLSNENIR